MFSLFILKFKFHALFLCRINPFLVNVPVSYSLKTPENLPILYLLKTPENQRFSGVFRRYEMGSFFSVFQGYEMGVLAWTGLSHTISILWYISKAWKLENERQDSLLYLASFFQLIWNFDECIEWFCDTHRSTEVYMSTQAIKKKQVSLM